MAVRDASEVAAGPVGLRARFLPETVVSLAEIQAAVNMASTLPGSLDTDSSLSCK